MLRGRTCATRGRQFREGNGDPAIIGLVRRLFHKPSPEAALTEVSPDLLERFITQPGFLWLDLEGEEPAEVMELGVTLGLDPSTVQEAAEESLRPRVDEHPEYVFVVLNGVAAGESTRLRNSEVDMFIGERILITIERAALPTVEAIQDLVGQPTSVFLSSPAHLAASIGMLISKRMVPLIEALEARIDELEELAFKADPLTLADVHALRRDTVVLRRIVVPQREVFSDLALSTNPVIDKTASRAFDATHEHHSRVADYLDGARALLASVLETYRGAVADQTNEIVRILTVFSATLLPLGLIAGIWGMNFANLPGSTLDWGFYVLIGVMAVVAVGFWIYFSRRGFVGAPRLRDLPRSVGLGLVQVGVAPIKTVASGMETTVRTVGRYLTFETRDTDTPPGPDQG